MKAENASFRKGLYFVGDSSKYFVTSVKLIFKKVNYMKKSQHKFYKCKMDLRAYPVLSLWPIERFRWTVLC